MNFLESFISFGNTLLWSHLLIYLLIGLGLYFTFRSGFVQFRYFGEMFRLLADRSSSKRKGISSLQAFFISAASRIGTGNLAGVAIAIAVGGPGAVFWMWLIAVFGMASSFIESTLAQVYKVKDGDSFRGGPAYYMEKALNAKWMGIIFAVLITFCFGLAFNSVQANTISLAFQRAYNMNETVIGIILVIFTGIIIFGGLKRIAKASQIIVPVMAFIYIIIALVIVFMNITEIPSIIGIIFANAFGLQEVVGGGIGAAIENGIKRGLFSNEAGMGSAPNAAATATVSHPAKQGFVQALGVFFDTIIICTTTAVMILLFTSTPDPALDGIQITQAAMAAHIGDWAQIFVAVAIFLFAFSSIIGNYYYGETNIEFLSGNRLWINLYRWAVLAMVLFGSISGFQFVWNLADLFMGAMAITNLIAIMLLAGIAIKVLKDYTRQRKEGKDPVFQPHTIAGLKNVEAWDDHYTKETDK
ncbi:alanine/glycine:cation symporter family protein [Metabacillus fastidiosus]|uniref:alanine/glycine:cation symporter family protein n=1 Tax=Metabacillus fastidiosus TaxID=1458 RepID=UPI002DBFC99E|nr:alanine/glycine:cation symporter family protein [Metabacillus fastidiosus]MEC2076680.1 alanine/glycine:cation symporter family protein [Metabacillus fastidiosus]